MHDDDTSAIPVLAASDMKKRVKGDPILRVRVVWRSGVWSLFLSVSVYFPFIQSWADIFTPSPPFSHTVLSCLLGQMGACSTKNRGRGQITILHQPNRTGCAHLALVPLIPDYFPRAEGVEGPAAFSAAFQRLHEIKYSEEVRSTFRPDGPVQTVAEFYETSVVPSALALAKHPNEEFPLPVAVMGCATEGGAWEVVGFFACYRFSLDGTFGAQTHYSGTVAPTARGDIIGIFRDRSPTSLGHKQFIGSNIVRLAMAQYRLAFGGDLAAEDVPWPQAVEFAFYSYNLGCATLVKELACYARECGAKAGVTVLEEPAVAAIQPASATHDGRHHVRCTNAETISRVCSLLGSEFHAPKTASLRHDFWGLSSLLGVLYDEPCRVVALKNVRGCNTPEVSTVPLIAQLMDLQSQARAEAAARKEQHGAPMGPVARVTDTAITASPTDPNVDVAASAACPEQRGDASAR